MSVRILFSTLRRRSFMPTLVMLQVALACAILSNVSFLAWQQMEPMLAPSGVDTENLILVDGLDAPNRSWTKAEVQAGTEALREVPGVRAVSAAMGLPMVVSVLSVRAYSGPTGVKVGANAYEGDDLLDTLGLQLVSGRNFLSSEYRDIGSDQGKGVPEPVIITQSLARQMFGDSVPLGQLLHSPGDGTDPGSVVVGVVRHLLRNQVGMATNGRADDTVLLPDRVADSWLLSYAVRVDPQMRAAALRGVRKAVKKQFGPLLPTGSTPKSEFYATRRAEVFKSRRAALVLFAGVALTVMAVTVIGIMGLTGFWVQKRTPQIGIRRALGARRSDILRYFLAENTLIVGTGVALGMALAYFGNSWLMRYYELPHLPWAWLPLGAAAMVLVGQLAALGPALRAAAVPPIVATRTR
ncbi:ABC transporter permease [Dyella mobilis]|uniref:ABC transporter permease n=1 Tax=Dyella mobilis TaxID=1849582 RepID=A0ABS2KC54_9GAMM|nr:FtsX-like permease family protein [Dyella mobilis]MBM7128615.1 ABC transporter permease [Dyella mobilis]GLQ99481.1 ABC transporter permease [Dyella mobilis]